MSVCLGFDLMGRLFAVDGVGVELRCFGEKFTGLGGGGKFVAAEASCAVEQHGAVFFVCDGFGAF